MKGEEKIVTRSIKISLCLSLIVHSVIGVTFCFMQTKRASTAPESPPVLTINLIKDFTPEPAPAAASATTPVPPQHVAVEPAPEIVAATEPKIEPAVLPATPEPVATKPVVSTAPPAESLLPPQTSSQIPAVAAKHLSPPTVGGFSTGAKPDILAHPAYRKNPEPVYPLVARRRRQEGMVLLAVTVSAQGKAAMVELKQTSGFPLLDEAALQTIRDWEFEPARRGGLPVDSQIEVPVRYQLSQ